MNPARRSADRTAFGDLERTLATTTKVVIALVLLTPLIVMAPPLPHTFFPFIVGKAIYTHTLIEIALAMWVLLALRCPAYRPVRSWLLPIFAVYVAVVLLASLSGVSPQRSLWSTYERMQGFVDLAHWFVFIVVISSVYRSWVDWRALLNFNLGISIVMALLGLGQRYDILVSDYLATTERVDITLGNPTYVGAYMLVNILIALGFLGHSLMRAAPKAVQRAPARRRRRRRARRAPAEEEFPWEVLLRTFWITAIVLDGLILYMSGTRGAVVGLAGGMIAFAVGYLIWGRDRRIKLAALFLIGSVVGLGLVFVAVRSTAAFDRLARSSVMLSRLAKISLDDESVAGRVNSAVVGLQGFAARPVLGWGPENFTIAYDRYVTSDIVAQEVISFDQAHNKLIEELTTKGILGFLGYVTVWTYMLWVIARRVREQDSQAQLFTMFAGAALAAYFSQNLFLFDTPGTVPQFYLLFGFVVYLDITAPEAAISAQVPRDAARPESIPASSGRLRVLQSDWALALAFVAVPMLAVLAVYYFNVRAYNGATTILKTIQTQTSWYDRLEYFEGSIDSAPPLANYPRIVMFNQLTRNWSDLDEGQAAAALETAAREGDRGIEKEPQEWRLYLALAGLYHRASSSGPSYLPQPKEFYVSKSRDLIQEAERLAPERIEVHQLLVRQDIMEKNYEAARNRIAEYLARNSKAERHFEALRSEIDRVAGQ